MNAGRELDVLMATQVMHWRLLMPIETEHVDVNDQMCVLEPHDGLLRYYHKTSIYWELRPWSPSTDIAAAWQVLEKMRQDHLHIEIAANTQRFYIALRRYDHESIRILETWTAVCTTAPLAICLAALEAVER